MLIIHLIVWSLESPLAHSTSFRDAFYRSSHPDKYSGFHWNLHLSGAASDIYTQGTLVLPFPPMQFL